MDISERKILKPKSPSKKASAGPALDRMTKRLSDFWTGAVRDEWDIEDLVKAFPGKAPDVATVKAIVSQVNREETEDNLITFKVMKATYIDAIATMIEKQDPQYLRFRERMKVIKREMQEAPFARLLLYYLYDSNCQKPNFTRLDGTAMRLYIAYYELYEAMVAGDIPSWDAIVKTKYRNIRDRELEKHRRSHGKKHNKAFATTNMKLGHKPAFFPCMVMLQQAIRSSNLLMASMNHDGFTKDSVTYLRFVDTGLGFEGTAGIEKPTSLAEIHDLEFHVLNEPQFVEKSMIIADKFLKAGIDYRIIDRLFLSHYQNSGWYRYAFEQLHSQAVKDGKEEEFLMGQPGSTTDFTYRLETEQDRAKPKSTERLVTPDREHPGQVKTTADAKGARLAPSERVNVTKEAAEAQRVTNDQDDPDEGAWEIKPLSTHKVQLKKDTENSKSVLAVSDSKDLAPNIAIQDQSATMLAMLTPDGQDGNDHNWYLDQLSVGADPDREKLLKLVKIQYRSCLCIEILANKVRERSGILDRRVRMTGTLQSCLEQMDALLKEYRMTRKIKSKPAKLSDKPGSDGASHDKGQSLVKVSHKLKRPIMLGAPIMREEEAKQTPLHQLVLETKIGQRRALNFGWLNKLGADDESGTMVERAEIVFRALGFKQVMKIHNQLNVLLQSALKADPEMVIDAVLMQKVVAPDLEALFK